MQVKWDTFGTCCRVDGLGTVAKAFYSCNELRIVVLSSGVTLACAMEIFEKGLLPERDVSMKLNFGNSKAMDKLVEQQDLGMVWGIFLPKGRTH